MKPSLGARFLYGAAAVVLAAGVGTPAADAASTKWVAVWANSSTKSPSNTDACPAKSGLTKATVRNVLYPSASGTTARVRVTNVFGDRALRIGKATIALRAAGAAVVPGTVKTLKFGGRTATTLAAGGLTYSDPVKIPVVAGVPLAVSVYVPGASGPATQHPRAMRDNYIGKGNQAATAGGTAYGTTIDCSLFVDAVDVTASATVTGTLVTLGDSITDGVESTPNTNNRYPDHLARLLQARPGGTLAVANAGISGNEVLKDRDPTYFGPSAQHRLTRDVLYQPQLRDVILLEGINDIGAEGASASSIIGGYKKIIARVHAHGTKIYGGTLTAFGGSHGQFGGQYGTAYGEKQRTAVNTWIRTSGAFDGVIDFDKATADPADPTRMLPAYDSGDHLHPGDTGYAVMGATAAIPELLNGG